MLIITSDNYFDARESLIYVRGHCDAPLCKCGNDALGRGFIPLRASGYIADVEWYDNRLNKTLCLQCGRVYFTETEPECPVDLPRSAVAVDYSEEGYGIPTGKVFGPLGIAARLAAHEALY